MDLRYWWNRTADQSKGRPVGGPLQTRYATTGEILPNSTKIQIQTQCKFTPPPTPKIGKILHC